MASSTDESIEVFGIYYEELAADAADLFVNVTGSSLFTGRAAVTQAKEVAAIVHSLKAAGLDADAVEVVSVRAEGTKRSARQDVLCILRSEGALRRPRTAAGTAGRRHRSQECHPRSPRMVLPLWRRG